MPKFSAGSFEALSTAHEDLQLLFQVVIRGFDCKVLCGHRDEVEQEKARVSGRSKLAWPHSPHNRKPSRAVDVAPWPIPNAWGAKDPAEYEKFRYFGFYVLGVAQVLLELGAITHRIRWGGDWDGDHDVGDQKFNDLVHFELEED